MTNKKKKKSGNLSNVSSSFGQKHLVKCRCVLPQMKAAAISHEFPVFSEVVDGTVKTKYAQCNNCGIIHKIVDICTSEIMNGKEAMSSIVSLDDIKISMNPKLVAILEKNNCDLPTWEHAKYIVDNSRWGEVVVLSSDVEGDSRVIKYMKIISETFFNIDMHIRKEMLGE
jgi:hypothetical protein